MSAIELVTGPAPCDLCRFRERCAREFLACAAFSAFLHGARWQQAPRAPTRAIYLASFSRGMGKGGRPRNGLVRGPDRRAREELREHPADEDAGRFHLALTSQERPAAAK